MSLEVQATRPLERPTLRTMRLILRPMEPADAPEVQRLAGDRAVADMTMRIPHPYPDGVAEQWIGRQAEAWRCGESLDLGAVLTDGQFIGVIGLTGFSAEHEHAELGYWIGRPWWGQGYCTEAARALLRWAFETLGLHRVHAQHFRRNPASGRVMQKLGMRREGTLRQHVRKWGAFEDLEVYGLLRGELQKG